MRLYLDQMFHIDLAALLRSRGHEVCAHRKPASKQRTTRKFSDVPLARAAFSSPWMSTLATGRSPAGQTSGRYPSEGASDDYRKHCQATSSLPDIL